jgi:hypothetical protein
MTMNHPDFLAAKAILVGRYGLHPEALAASASMRGHGRNHADPNVVGVAIGEKETLTGNTGVQSVRLFVKKKLPKSQLSKDEIIPSAIGGLPVDVVQTGVFKARAVAPPNPRSHLRPALPGCSVGYDLGDDEPMAGTFGALVEDSTGRIYILSNNHVLAAEDALAAAGSIFQPGLLDGGKVKRDLIARLTRAVRMTDAGMNLVDAAIAEVLDKSTVEAGIPVIGAPKGHTKPARNIIVHKFGRTTGYTSGYISDTNATMKVRYGRGTLTFDDQLVIRSLERRKFSDGGDSGSLIVEKPTGKAVGLLFAGGTGYTLANPIQAVLKALKVQLVTEA